MKNQNYDVFISFAVKDRAELVHPLLILLQKQGLRVWYSSDELTIGESLERTILSGLEKSKFGLFLITPNSLHQPWPTNELNAMWSMGNARNTTLLPVLHNVSINDAVNKHPVLLDKWSLTTEKGLDHIASAVADKVRKYNFKKRLRLFRNIGLLLLVLFLVGLTGFREYSKYHVQAAYQSSSDQSLHLLLSQKIDQYMDDEDKWWAAYLEGQNAIPILNKTAIKKKIAFDKVDAYYRNYYQFQTKSSQYSNKIHVEPAAAISFDTVAVQNDFSFKHPLLYMINDSDHLNKFNLELSYFNTQPITYQITDQQQVGDTIYVSVSYSNHIRSIIVKLKYGAETGYKKVAWYRLRGLPPTENIKLTKIDSRWTVLSE